MIFGGTLTQNHAKDNACKFPISMNKLYFTRESLAYINTHSMHPVHYKTSITDKKISMLSNNY